MSTSDTMVTTLHVLSFVSRNPKAIGSEIAAAIDRCALTARYHTQWLLENGYIKEADRRERVKGSNDRGRPAMQYEVTAAGKKFLEENKGVVKSYQKAVAEAAAEAEAARKAAKRVRKPKAAQATESKEAAAA